MANPAEYSRQAVVGKSRGSARFKGFPDTTHALAERHSITA